MLMHFIDDAASCTGTTLVLSSPDQPEAVQSMHLLTPELVLEDFNTLQRWVDAECARKYPRIFDDKQPSPCLFRACEPFYLSLLPYLACPKVEWEKTRLSRHNEATSCDRLFAVCREGAPWDELKKTLVETHGCTYTELSGEYLIHLRFVDGKIGWLRPGPSPVGKADYGDFVVSYHLFHSKTAGDAYAHLLPWFLTRTALADRDVAFVYVRLRRTAPCPTAVTMEDAVAKLNRAVLELPGGSGSGKRRRAAKVEVARATASWQGYTGFWSALDGRRQPLGEIFEAGGMLEYASRYHEDALNLGLYEPYDDDGDEKQRAKVRHNYKRILAPAKAFFTPTVIKFLEKQVENGLELLTFCLTTSLGYCLEALSDKDVPTPFQGRVADTPWGYDAADWIAIRDFLGRNPAALLKLLRRDAPADHEYVEQLERRAQRAYSLASKDATRGACKTAAQALDDAARVEDPCKDLGDLKDYVTVCERHKNDVAVLLATSNKVWGALQLAFTSKTKDLGKVLDKLGRAAKSHYQQAIYVFYSLEDLHTHYDDDGEGARFYVSKCLSLWLLTCNLYDCLPTGPSAGEARRAACAAAAAAAAEEAKEVAARAKAAAELEDALRGVMTYLYGKLEQEQWKANAAAAEAEAAKAAKEEAEARAAAKAARPQEDHHQPPVMRPALADGGYQYAQADRPALRYRDEKQKAENLRQAAAHQRKLAERREQIALAEERAAAADRATRHTFGS